MYVEDGDAILGTSTERERDDGGAIDATSTVPLTQSDLQYIACNKAAPEAFDNTAERQTETHDVEDTPPATKEREVSPPSIHKDTRRMHVYHGSVE